MKNLIPFDLEKALAGEPVVTRDGRPAKIAGCNKEANDANQLAGWTPEGLLGWYADGHYTNDNESRNDLFMAPKPVEFYMNVGASDTGDERHTSLANAICKGGPKAVSVCKFTILDGEVVAHETVYKYNDPF